MTDDPPPTSASYELARHSSLERALRAVHGLKNPPMSPPAPYVCALCGWSTNDARLESHVCPYHRDPKPPPVA